jgi:hypothetical protein
MAKYTRTEEVDAEQVSIQDSDKASAKKGLPTTTGGGAVRYELGEDVEGKPKDFYTVSFPKVGRQASEGDWVVTDSHGQTTIVTNDAFGKIYKAVADQPKPAPAPAVATPPAHPVPPVQHPIPPAQPPVAPPPAQPTKAPDHV